MSILNLKFLALLLTLSTATLLSGCNNDTDCEEEPDNSDCQDDSTSSNDPIESDVVKKAYPILEDAGKLSQWKVSSFDEVFDGNGNHDYFAENMQVQIINYGAAQTSDLLTDRQKTEQPELNDLSLESINWENKTISWQNNQAPFSEPTSTYQKIKPYFLMNAGQLSSQINTRKNQPIYEAIRKNIGEKQLAVQFVWDLGAVEIENVATIRAELNVSGKRIRDYETHPDTNTIELLEHAATWGDDSRFSEGAIIYGGTRSVASTAILIESILEGDSFNISIANFSSGQDSIADAISPWPAGDIAANHLKYQFSVGFLEHASLNMQFDSLGKTVQIFTSNNADLSICVPGDADSKACDRFEVPYIEHSAENYIEIDISQLSNTRLESINLPGYFNPIIAGPFGDDKKYYYGKKYIETATSNRIKLQPLFWLNNVAASDLETAFYNWRQQSYDDAF